MQHLRPRMVICCLSLAVPYWVGNMAQAAAPTGYVMRIQMTPAVCSLDKSKQKQRQCLEGYALTIAGLLPETTARDCDTNSIAKLSPIQTKVIARIMPNETLRLQLWQEIGGCVPMNASQYFRTMIGFAEKLKIPTELSDGVTRSVTQTHLKQEFNKLNPTLKPQSMRLNCQVNNSKTLLTEIQICYQVNGQFKPCSPALLSNCPAEFNIQGSY